MSTSSVSFTTPHVVTQAKAPVTLNERIWLFRSQCCRGGMDDLVASVYAKIIAGVIALLSFFPLRALFTASPIGTVLSVLTAMAIGAVFYGIVGWKYLQIFPGELNAVLADIVGKEAFKKLPHVHSEKRWDTLPIKLPPEPMFIFTTLDKGVWERDDPKHKSYGLPPRPATYRSSFVIAYHFPNENKNVVESYPIYSNGKPHPSPLVTVTEEMRTKQGEALPYELRDAGKNGKVILKRTTALLLKELITTGSCQYDPQNPSRKIEVRLGHKL